MGEVFRDTMVSSRLLILPLAFAFACGGATSDFQGPGTEPMAFDEALGEARDPEAPRAREGAIDRRDLMPVLDAGIGRFLSGVELRPSRAEGGEFEGFELVRFEPSYEGLATVDLRAGDVVMNVNGESIGRPDEAFAVWESLREASTLIVAVRRGTELFSLEFSIRD